VRECHRGGKGGVGGEVEMRGGRGRGGVGGGVGGEEVRWR